MHAKSYTYILLLSVTVIFCDACSTYTTKLETENNVIKDKVLMNVGKPVKVTVNVDGQLLTCNGYVDFDHSSHQVLVYEYIRAKKIFAQYKFNTSQIHHIEQIQYVEIDNTPLTIEKPKSVNVIGGFVVMTLVAGALVVLILYTFFNPVTSR